MITLSETGKLSIPELEEACEFTFKSLWIEYGINGILPRLQLDLDGFSSEVKYESFSFKLIFNNIEYANCKCCVESFELVDTRLHIVAYMITDLKFIRERRKHSYKSIKEACNSIWEGENNLQFPDLGRLYLCQNNELNHKYLTNLLACNIAEQSFYYDLFNSIQPVQLANRPVDFDLTKSDETEALPLIQVKGRNINSFKSTYNFCAEDAGQLVNKWYIVAGDMIYYGDKEHYNLEFNRVRSMLILHRKDYELEIEYDNRLNIKVGDVIKAKLTDTSNITYMIVSSQIHIIPNQMTVISRCIEYG